MVSDTEEETINSDSEWILYNYDDFNGSWSSNYTDQKFYFEKPTGISGIMTNIIMILVYPTILISNGILLAMILKNKKIRSEPWRWLTVHTSLCIFVTSFFLWINFFTTVYLLPSFETTVICPAVKVIEALFWQMYPISVTLVAIERYRAIKQDNFKSGGMGKKAVIISLAVFWFANIVVHGIGWAVMPDHPAITYYEWLPDMKMCFFHHHMVTQFAKMIVAVWSMLSMIVVIIGSSVTTCKKSDTAMKKFVFVPTLVIAVSYLLVYFSIYLVELLVLELTNGIGKELATLLHLIFPLAWIIFPLTWIIVWTLNEDLNWNRRFFPCCPQHNDEEIQLLEKDAE